MVDIRGFKGIRPKNSIAGQISDLPYDVVDTKRAKAIVEENPLSFLKIDRAEVNFDDIKFNDEKVYLKAKNLIDDYLEEGLFLEDDKEDIYIYELTFENRTQYGIVCLSSVEDYINGNIKIHEYTLPEKEIDRTKHIDITDYHTGPIFLLYKKQKQLDNIVKDTVKKQKPRFDFTTKKGVRHRGFLIEDNQQILDIFKNIDKTYIADGHHRCKSAVNVYLDRKKQNRDIGESKYFLSVIFPTDEVEILPYNRYLSDLNNFTKEEILEKLKENFIVKKLENGRQPENKYDILMYIDKDFYNLRIKNGLIGDDILEKLDISVAQKYIFDEIFDIKDPRNDKRIEFVGGIEGLDYLVDLVDTRGGVAFAMYPTQVEELIQVADEDKVMPPKSTWFEPKLNSGLFLHKI